MHRFAARVTLVVAVVASGIAAAFFLRDIDRETAALAAVQQHSFSRLDRLTAAIAAAGHTQQSYIAPGQIDQRAFEHMTELVRQIYDATAALKPTLRSPDAASAIQELNAATGNLIAADARARENLRLGQDAMAADVIHSDGRSTLEGMDERVGRIRAAELVAHEAAVSALASRRWTILGLMSLAWLAAILALVPIRRPDTAVIPQPETPVAAPVEQIEAPVAIPPSVDLAGAAGLCTAISRIISTADLSPLVARTAALLDASGIILWMGAGEELFPVTSHGYRPDIVSRLGPIARAANNATAAAWRGAETTVVAGDDASSGAIVAPMFGPDACIGVLAIELRNGRERDPAVAAVASLIAAQLSTVVSAWPAASSAPDLRAANG